MREALTEAGLPRSLGTRPQLRLLPWAGCGEKPFYLSPAAGGFLSRLADVVEEEQLTLASDLLDQVEELANRDDGGPDDIRLLVSPLCDALRDVLRVAVSRGARLAEDADGERRGLPASRGDEGLWELASSSSSPIRYSGACVECGEEQAAGEPTARRAYSWFARHAETTGDRVFKVLASQSFTVGRSDPPSNP
ncbi:hypothetical protein [Streptomyces sp. I05A-00742]|uniref:hypothetical protein n=1 Tax=Streptomyces sp. I05A-00742 TaxID=2732853 RepID=UPI001BB29581|nr:hypothetical protein [Streptomyces sp. I05A-00742]